MPSNFRPEPSYKPLKLPVQKRRQNEATIPDVEGKTSLHRALEELTPGNYNYNKINGALEHDANINHQDNEGQTPLHIVAKKNDKAALDIILNQNPDLTIQDNKGNTALHIAADSNNIYAIQKILAKDPDLANVKNKNGRTPLLEALLRSNWSAVDELLNYSKETLSQADTFGMTALHLAIIGNVRNRQTKQLDQANIGTRKKIIEVLVDTEILNAKTNNNETALDLTLIKQDNAIDLKLIELDKAMEKLLLSKGAKTSDPEKMLPILLDAVKNDKQLAKDIIKCENQRAIDKQLPETGHTLLHYAAEQNNLEAVKFLVENGADINAALTNGGTALHIAVKKNNEAMVRYLLENKANPNKKAIIEMSSSNGKSIKEKLSPLELTKKVSNTNLIKPFEEFFHKNDGTIFCENGQAYKLCPELSPDDVAAIEKQTGFALAEGEFVRSGSFGEVVIGFDLKDNTYYAIKKINPDKMEICAKEVEMQSLVKGKKGVLSIVDSLKTEDGQYLVMPLMPLGDLDQASEPLNYLPPNSYMKVAFFMTVLKDILEGLKALAEENIAHGDLKKSNVLTSFKEFTISDFGEAVLNNRQVDISNGFLGDTSYAAPELIEAHREDKSEIVDRGKVDVWALGVTLLDLLGFEPYFETEAGKEKRFFRGQSNAENSDFEDWVDNTFKQLEQYAKNPAYRRGAQPTREEDPDETDAASNPAENVDSSVGDDSQNQANTDDFNALLKILKKLAVVDPAKRASAKAILEEESEAFAKYVPKTLEERKKLIFEVYTAKETAEEKGVEILLADTEEEYKQNIAQQNPILESEKVEDAKKPAHPSLQRKEHETDLQSSVALARDCLLGREKTEKEEMPQTVAVVKGNVGGEFNYKKPVQSNPAPTKSSPKLATQEKLTKAQLLEKKKAIEQQITQQKLATDLINYKIQILQKKTPVIQKLADLYLEYNSQVNQAQDKFNEFNQDFPELPTDATQLENLENTAHKLSEIEAHYKKSSDLKDRILKETKQLKKMLAALDKEIDRGTWFLSDKTEKQLVLKDLRGKITATQITSDKKTVKDIIDDLKKDTKSMEILQTKRSFTLGFFAKSSQNEASGQVQGAEASGDNKNNQGKRLSESTASMKFLNDFEETYGDIELVTSSPSQSN